MMAKFLSNFYECPVEYKGLTYRCSEAAFQAQKDPSRAAEFCNLNGAQAKRLGKKVQLPEDWNERRIQVMTEVVRAKFQNPKLRQQLLDTGNDQIIETNTWGDRFWGVCGSGQNHLGKILMMIRNEIRLDF